MHGKKRQYLQEIPIASDNMDSNGALADLTQTSKGALQAVVSAVCVKARVG